MEVEKIVEILFAVIICLGTIQTILLLTFVILNFVRKDDTKERSDTE